MSRPGAGEPRNRPGAGEPRNAPADPGRPPGAAEPRKPPGPAAPRWAAARGDGERGRLRRRSRPDRILVLGGARSGKSTAAERMLAEAGRVHYIATGARPDGTDPDWAAKIRAHQKRRPGHWATIETLDLEAVLDGKDLAPAEVAVPVLIECLSTWLARVMERSGLWDGRPGAEEEVARTMDLLVDAWRSTSRPAIAVSNEVGSGVVPATVAGMRFRDDLGALNARIAAESNQVWLCTAGILQRLK